MTTVDPDITAPLTVPETEVHGVPSAVEIKNKNRVLALILFTIFLDVLGYGILVPAIPYLIEPFSKSALAVGVLMTSFSVAQFFAAPVLGALSDRWGRRPVLLYSIMGGGIAYFAFGFAAALWVFFAARIVDGLSGGNLATAQAYITDITPAKDRAQKFGMIGAAFGLGFVIGPALGGLLSHYFGLQAPAFAGGILSLIAVTFGFFMLPETLPKEKRKNAKIVLADFNPLGQLWRFVSIRSLMLIFTARFMLMFAMTIMRSNFPVYAREHLNFDPLRIGIYYAVLGFLIAGVQGGAIKPLVRTIGEARTTFYGFTSMIIGLFLMSFAPGLALVCVAALFIGVGHGMAFPALTSLTSNAVGDADQGAVLGAQASVNSVAMMTAPFLAGLAFDHISMGAPYMMGVAVLLIGLGVVWNWTKAKKQIGADERT